MDSLMSFDKMLTSMKPELQSRPRTFSSTQAVPLCPSDLSFHLHVLPQTTTDLRPAVPATGGEGTWNHAAYILL